MRISNPILNGLATQLEGSSDKQRCSDTGQVGIVGEPGLSRLPATLGGLRASWTLCLTF